MRHSYFDEYSGLDSFIRRISAKVKLFYTVAFILLFTYIPQKYFYLPALILLIFIFLSKVPPILIIRRSFIAVPFLMLAVISNKWILVLRAYFAVTASILLSFTSRFIDILGALKYYGCPKIFLMMMAFMYRYIFVAEDELMRMKQAKDSRTIKKGRGSEMKILSRIIGLLFVRSYERAERVYMAMCARGFTGEIK